MADKKYCYPNTDILVNKLNIINKENLFQAEKELTFIRLQELQEKPIIGNFDFSHLLRIHEYIFQDIYEWAGQIRTVEIGKGNLFCTTACIQSYGESVFNKYYAQCKDNERNRQDFIKALSDNYADLNALHPFREGNGRAQREFARTLCLDCGYIFDLSCTTHEEMLKASQIAFDKGDNTFLHTIFSKAVLPKSEYIERNSNLKILTSNDLVVGIEKNSDYVYYESSEITNIDDYNNIYFVRTQKNIDFKPK